MASENEARGVSKTVMKRRARLSSRLPSRPGDSGAASLYAAYQ